jgi:hypothetical protein
VNCTASFQCPDWNSGYRNSQALNLWIRAKNKICATVWSAKIPILQKALRKTQPSHADRCSNGPSSYSLQVATESFYPASLGFFRGTKSHHSRRQPVYRSPGARPLFLRDAAANPVLLIARLIARQSSRSCPKRMRGRRETARKTWWNMW